MFVYQHVAGTFHLLLYSRLLSIARYRTYGALKICLAGHVRRQMAHAHVRVVHIVLMVNGTTQDFAKMADGAPVAAIFITPVGRRFAGAMGGSCVLEITPR